MFDWFWEFLYSIVKTVLYCIDFVLRIAGMLCGIETVEVNGQQTDITYYFLSSDNVLKSFKLVVLIGFILLFVFTIFSVVRSQAKLGEGKSPLRICLDSAKILLYFLLVPAIMLLGCVFVSTVMKSIYMATSVGTEGLGSSLFTIFADEAYTGTASEKTEIFQKFLNGTYDYYDTDKVEEYFNLSELNYFLAFVGGIAILILLALSLLSFVERIISLVILFIISPISMSSAALDDGARFKLWRDQVINKFLMAYGALIALNVFMLLVGVIYEITFFENDFMNGLARLVFVIGGAFACRRGTVLIGNLINSGAGSQDMMDQRHANAGFGRVAGLAMGAVGAVVGSAARVAKFPMQKAGESIHRKASAAWHREANAKRDVKASMAKKAYREKLKRAEMDRAQKAQGGAGANGKKEGLKETLKGKDLSNSKGGNPATPLNSGASTGDAQNLNNDQLNRESGQTVKDVMKNVTTRTAEDNQGGNKE